MIKDYDEQPFIVLYRRKSIPLNLSEKIKCKYICHPGNVIQYGLYSSVERIGLDVVLAGNPVDK